MFVLPNGTVIDPDRMDRQMLLSQIADRRAKAHATRQSSAQLQAQQQALERESEMARAEREQEGMLAREEMSLRKTLAEQAEKAATDRLTAQFNLESKAMADRELSAIGAEEGLALGLAKRLNDLTAQLGPAPQTPAELADWQANISRIRASVPANLEMALERDSSGRWRINPSYFQARRARWQQPSPDLVSAISAAGPQAVIQPQVAGPTDELLARSLMTISRGPSPGAVPPMATPSVPTPRVGFQSSTSPVLPPSGYVPPPIGTPPIAPQGGGILQMLANAMAIAGRQTMPSYPIFPPERPMPIRQIGGGLEVIGQTSWP